MGIFTSDSLWLFFLLSWDFIWPVMKILSKSSCSLQYQQCLVGWCYHNFDFIGIERFAFSCCGKSDFQPLLLGAFLNGKLYICSGPKYSILIFFLSWWQHLQFVILCSVYFIQIQLWQVSHSDYLCFVFCSNMKTGDQNSQIVSFLLEKIVLL